MAKFTVDAAELNPALSSLAPVTRARRTGEHVEAGSCEMVYCKTTNDGNLMLATADSAARLLVSAVIPIYGFDGEMVEFAIDREKLKQITAIFKPKKDDPVPVSVEVSKDYAALGVREQVITLTEDGAMHSPVSLSFAGAEWDEIPWREILKGISNHPLGKPAPCAGTVSTVAYGKLKKAADTYGADGMVTTEKGIVTVFGERVVAFVGAWSTQENPPQQQQEKVRAAAARIAIIAESIEGTGPMIEAASAQEVVSDLSDFADGLKDISQGDFGLASE